MVEEKVSEPPTGTAKSCVLVAMYLRWSYTLKSKPVWKTGALMVKLPPETSRVSPSDISPRPYGFAHLAP